MPEKKRRVDLTKPLPKTIRLSGSVKEQPPVEFQEVAELPPEVELTEEEYADEEDEWANETAMDSESEARGIFRDFNAASKGISGMTDLTPKQAVFLTVLRNLAKDYSWCAKELGLTEIALADWFETYRLSIKRGSRRETQEMFRGRMQLKDQNLQNGDQNQMVF